MKQSRKLFASAALVAMFVSWAAHATPAVTVSTVAGSPFDTSTVAQALTGAGMTGMSVTACLISGTCETLNWAAMPAVGTDAGGVVGANWSLGLNGDSFGSRWVFASTSGAWKSLTINARGGLTAFDWIDSPTGSPGSESGNPFTVAAFAPNTGVDADYSISAVYSDVLYVGGQLFDDLYTVLTIDISHVTGLGFGGSMEFLADTDRTADITPHSPPPQIPAPATLALVGLGLAGVAASRRGAAART